MTATDFAGGSQPALEGSSVATSGITASTANDDGGLGSAGGALAGNTVGDSEVGSSYHLKWIQWNSGKIPIVMQCKNGPCPLIATMNVLLLREKVKLPTMLEQITADQLLTYLGECIMESVPTDIQNDENAMLNVEQHIHDAMEILPKLKTGLDVNIRFTGITDFEYTPECIIFDLLRIPLYHGWLIDTSLEELQNAIGNQSYNQLVDNIISNKNSTDPEAQARVLIAEEFLEQTASQLTLHGLNELKSRIKDNEIGILFRNNHFLTLFKREGEIYNLVTDHGYLTEDNIIWETLDNIEGAGRFFDSNFQPSEVTTKQVSVFNALDQLRQQLESDFLIALSLKEEEDQWRGGKEGQESAATSQESAATSQLPPQDDFELAKQLQAEEDRMYEELLRERQAREDQQQQQQLVIDKKKQVVPIDHFNPSGQTTVSASSSETFSATQKSATAAATTPETLNPADEAEFPPLAVSTTENFKSKQGQEETGTASSTSATDLNAPGAQSTSSLDSQNDSRPPPTRKLSNRRLKSEKNSKETNCIVN